MNNRRRKRLMAMTMCICVVYLLYRGLFTLNLASPFAATFSIALYLAEIYGNMLMFLYFMQIWEPDLPEPVTPLENVSVDVYIPTYNEEPELLRGTIEAALAIDYPHQTYILDDSQRDEVRELCAELGANYIRRDNNMHAKAGNLNNALERTTGEYVVILDADHIAERNFITRTLGYFADERLAFVQTPHAYYNFDSFQGSLDYQKRLYWEEGQLYYNIVQPGKNHWNAVSFCGSAAIFRKSALESVGLIATETITEDMQTGLRLHADGWKALYINERLVTGLAPPDLKTFLIQRLRWGEGNLGTFFYDNPITKPGLTLAQRLNYLGLMLSWTTGVQKLVLYCVPILMLLCGVGPVADITWHLVAVTVLYMASIWITVKKSGNGYTRLVDAEISQMATFWTHCQATWRAIFGRKNATFVVTKKSGNNASGIHTFLRPHYTYIAAGAVAITWSVSRYFLGIHEDLVGLTVCTGLVSIHACFAWVVIRRALAQRRFNWRHPVAAHVKYRVRTADGYQEGEGFTKDLSEVGTGFICYDKLDGYDVRLTITAGDTSVTVNGRVKNWKKLTDVSSRRDGDITSYRYGVGFVDTTTEQLRDLWHICTRYAVARRYHDFDPNCDTDLLEGITGETDTKVLLPVSISDGSGSEIVGVTESLTNNEFTILTHEEIDSNQLHVSLSTPSGQLAGEATPVQSRPIQLGSMPLHAHRIRLDHFEGQSRGKLTALLQASTEPEMRTTVTLAPERTRLPLLYPASIASGLAAIAAMVALGVTFFVCNDEVLIARTLLDKPIAAAEQQQLIGLVDGYVENPTRNERLFLRLRDAMQKLKATDAVDRMNRALVDSSFRTPNGKLQQAFAMEKLGRIDEAETAFGHLIATIDQFKNRNSRTRLVLGAARNHANQGDYAAAVGKYKFVWKQEFLNAEIRSEFGGVLASAKNYEAAIAVLRSDKLTRSDQFLLASVYMSLKQPQNARTVLESVLLANPDSIEARRGLGDLAAWSDDYEAAIQQYRTVLRENQNDLLTRLALTRALSWNKQSRDAITEGLEVLNQVPVDQELKLWIPMLESVKEISEPLKVDRSFVLNVFSARERHADNKQFVEQLGRTIGHLFSAEQSIPMLEKLIGLQPTSPTLQGLLAEVLHETGEFEAASRYYAALSEEHNLPSDLTHRGQVHLAAALNSQRRGAVKEASRRYAKAQACFVKLVQEDQQDTKRWGALFEAVSAARSHTQETTACVIDTFSARTSVAKDPVLLEQMSDALAAISRNKMSLQVLNELVLVRDDVETRWRQANTLQRLEQPQDAEPLYAELLATGAFAGNEPRAAELMLAAASNSARLGNIAEANNRYARAMKWLGGQLKQTPDNTRLWTPFLSACAGSASVGAGDLAIVKTIFDSRSDLSEDRVFLQRLNDVLQAAGEHSLSAMLLRELSEDAAHPNTRLRLAQTLQASGDLQNAQREYQYLLAVRGRQGLPADFDDVSLLLGAAQTSEMMRRPDRARKLFRETASLARPNVQKNLQDSTHWLAYVSSLRGLGEVTSIDVRLLEQIRRSVDLETVSAAFIAQFTEVLADSGQQDVAIGLLEQSLLEHQQDHELRKALARRYSAVRQHAKAAIQYNWLVRQTTFERPTDRVGVLLEASENSRQLARLEEAQERSTEALAIVSEVLAENPSNPGLQQQFLDAAAAAKDLTPQQTQTVNQLFRDWKTQAQNLIFIDRLTDVLVAMGDKRRAMTLLEHRESESPRHRLRLAQIFAELGEHDQAEPRYGHLMQTRAFGNEPDLQVDLLLSAANSERIQNGSAAAAQYYDSALTLARTQLKTAPENSRTQQRFLDAATGATTLGDEDQSLVENICKTSASSVNGNSRLQFARLLRNGNPQLAEQQYEWLIQHSSKQGHELANLLLEAAMNKRNLSKRIDAGELYERAFKQLHPVVTANPDKTDHWQALLDAAAGAQNLHKDNAPVVLGIFERRATMKQSLEFTTRLSDVLNRFGEYERMILVLSEIEQKNHDVHYQLATALMRLDRHVEAEEHFALLLRENAFKAEERTRGELLLAAAGNARVIGNGAETAARDQDSLLIWRKLYDRHPDDVTIWRRYLDAAARTPKLLQADVKITHDIFDNFEQHTILRNDRSFLLRLVDALIHIKNFEAVYPLTRALYVRAAQLRRESLSVVAPSVPGNLRSIPPESLLRGCELTEQQHNEVRLRMANNLHALSWFRLAEPMYDNLIEANAFQSDDETRGQMMVTAARNHAALRQFGKARRLFETMQESKLSSRKHDVEYAVLLMKTGDAARGRELLLREPLTLDEQYRLAAMYTAVAELALADDVYDNILSHHANEQLALRRHAAVNVWLGNHTKARKLLRNLLADSPDDFELQKLLAQSQLFGGEPVAALSLLRKLYKQQPSDTDTDVLLLKAIDIAENFDQADKSHVMTSYESYRAANGSTGESLDVPLALAGALDKSGETDSAIALLRDILENPSAFNGLAADKQLDVRFKYATLLHGNGQFSDAQKELEHLVHSVTPGDKEKYRAVQLVSARNLVRLERYTEAVERFDAIREFDPTEFDLFEEYAGVLITAGELDRSLSMLRESNDLSLKGKYLLSDIFVLQKRFDLAANVFSDILTTHPTETRALRGRADCLVWNQDYQTALPLYEQLLRDTAGSQSLQIAYAQALLWSGSSQAALDHLTDVLAVAPDRRDLWSSLLEAAGGNNVQLDATAKAIIAQIVAREAQWPNTIAFRKALSRTLLRIGQDTRAITMLEELVRSHPDSREIRRTLADSLHALGRFEEAEQHYVELLRLGKSQQQRVYRPSKRRLSARD